MSKEDLTIQSIGTTQFKVEKRKEGLWSEGPEICIAHFSKGKRSQNNPSVPLDQIPELIEYLVKAYGDMREDLAVQDPKPVS